MNIYLRQLGKIPMNVAPPLYVDGIVCKVSKLFSVHAHGINLRGVCYPYALNTFEFERQSK